MRIKQTGFGHVAGVEIIETTMVNRQGMKVSSCTYGATITKILTANRQGTLENIVCGFSSVDGYVENPQFFGATIGPFAGRLENAEITLKGECVKISPNEGKHLLHGGADGFHQAIWSVSTEETTNAVTTIYDLHYSGGYPGEIAVRVKLTLTDENELIIAYEGTTSEDTLMNCTNHSYFNLSGNLKQTVHQQRLTIPADYYIPINKEGLPLGEYKSVTGTIFDLTEGNYLGNIISEKDEQLFFASGGLDHPFILNGEQIELVDEESGRRLTIITADQAVVVYTGNKMSDGYDFSEATSENYLGVCLEVQNVPNSSKYAHFPSSFLGKNECYKKTTIYQFTEIK